MFRRLGRGTHGEDAMNPADLNFLRRYLTALRVPCAIIRLVVHAVTAAGPRALPCLRCPLVEPPEKRDDGAPPLLN